MIYCGAFVIPIFRLIYICIGTIWNMNCYDFLLIACHKRRKKRLLFRRFHFGWAEHKTVVFCTVRPIPRRAASMNLPYQQAGDAEDAALFQIGAADFLGRVFGVDGHKAHPVFAGDVIHPFQRGIFAFV